MKEEYSWEQPYTMDDKTEPVQSFEAFKIWLEMGSNRSLKAVAERVEKSHDTIKRYSCTWKWSERLQDKLSHENRIIHGKQLESVMTGLDIDSRRDIELQLVMGNVLSMIHRLSFIPPEHLETIYRGRTNKYEVNPHIDLMERLTKIYCKLEDSHTKNQQKIIEYNNKCLTYQDFNSPEEYREMLKHGQKEYARIMVEYSEKVMNEGLKNQIAGTVLMSGGLYEPYESHQVDELETETPEEIPSHDKKGT